MTAFCFLILASCPVIINEVMSNPAGATGARAPEDRNEFVELLNCSSDPVDLNDWTLDDGDSRDWLTAWLDSSLLSGNPTLRISTTWLAPGGYAIVLDSEYTCPDPVGGHVRPYRFADSTLVLTTRNTTIGNGLAVDDPLFLASPWGDTSTFGTPLEPDDGFPSNPGDGVAWELVQPGRPDRLSSWMASLDPTGATPGRTNSLLSMVDLQAIGIELAQPGSLRPGAAATAVLTAVNNGYAVADGWHWRAWLDADADGRPGPGEDSTTIPGPRLGRLEMARLEFRFISPGTRFDIWSEVLPGSVPDLDSTNNRLRVSFDPAGASGPFVTLTSSFSPDGDGFEDSLGVAYRLPSTGGRLQVRIFDLAGRSVRTLYDGRPPAENGSLFWDGRRDGSDPAPAGIYAVWCEYRLPDLTTARRLPVVLLRRTP